MFEVVISAVHFGGGSSCHSIFNFSMLSVKKQI